MMKSEKGKIREGCSLEGLKPEWKEKEEDFKRERRKRRGLVSERGEKEES